MATFIPVDAVSLFAISVVVGTATTKEEVDFDSQRNRSLSELRRNSLPLSMTETGERDEDERV